MEKSQFIKDVDFSELEKKFEVADFPLNVAIEVGNFCNLKCTMCSNKSLKRKKGFMSMSLYRKLIDEIAAENPFTRVWLDFYGEPLLARYKLYFMIDYAKKKGLKNINMNTNGTLLDEEMIDMLLDSGIDFVSIDMDAFKKETFERIRVGADRDVVYENVRNFVKRKEERGLTKPVLEVKTIEMEENQGEIQDIIDYWKNFRIRINVRKLATWSGNVNKEDGSAQERNQTDRFACAFAIGQCIVAWDGSVPVCGWDCEIDEKIGDANVETIKEIWKKKVDGAIKLHMEHRFEELPDICKTCQDWRCVGGELRLDENGQSYDRSYGFKEAMIEE